MEERIVAAGLKTLGWCKERGRNEKMGHGLEGNRPKEGEKK